MDYYQHDELEIIRRDFFQALRLIWLYWLPLVWVLLMVAMLLFTTIPLYVPTAFYTLLASIACCYTATVTLMCVYGEAYGYDE